MPWTFAHPAAALAFNRVAKKPHEFAALVIGTISPDIGYYLGSAGLNLRTHSLIGSVTMCLPMALVVLLAWILLRSPLCLLLPTPHRQALTPLLSVKAQLSFKAWADIKSGLRICIWILLGAWTHIIWDAGTHRGGLIVQHLAILQSLWLFGWPGYQLAQHLSSAFGAVAVGIYYRNWLRSKRIASQADDGFERWRWRLLFSCAAVAVLLGLQHALALASAVPIALFWRVLMFQFATRVTSVFAILMALCALWLFWRVRKADCNRTRP